MSLERILRHENSQYEAQRKAKQLHSVLGVSYVYRSRSGLDCNCWMCFVEQEDKVFKIIA